MLHELDCWFYYTSESEFIKYFDRLKAIGMGFNEIENKLSQLENYYFEMVIDNVFYVNIPTLYDLFNKWKLNRLG